MTLAGEAGLKPRPCQSCREPVYDLVYPRTGKPAPIEVRLSANGNVLVDLETGTYAILTGEALALARRGVSRLHVNHFVTCPAAASWRERSAQKAAR